MNDYDALRDYLKQQKLPEFVLSFDRIEEIIDAALRAPPIARRGGRRCAARRKDAAARGLPRRRLHRDRLADGTSVRFKKIVKKK